MRSITRCTRRTAPVDNPGSPRPLQPLHEPRQRLPMLLQHYGAAVLVAAEQLPEQLRHGLRCWRPGVVQPGSADRAGRLRPARHDRRAGQQVAQRLTQPPPLGRRHPAPEADAGGGHHHVHAGAEHRTGGVEQPLVVVKRHDLERRRLHDPGATAFQERDQLPAPPVSGHPDRVAGKRPALLVTVAAAARSRHPAGGPYRFLRRLHRTPFCPIGDQRPAAHSLGSTTVFRAGCGGTKSLFHACGTPAPRVSRPGWSTGTNGGSPAPPRPARPRAAS